MDERPWAPYRRRIADEEGTVRRRPIVALGVLVIAVGAAAAPAGAKVRPSVIDTSTVVAGYNADLSSAATMSLTLVVPTATCSPAVTAPLHIGMLFNGVISGTSGASFTGAYVSIYCSGSTASYIATAYNDGVPAPTFVVKPGHVVTVATTVGPASETVTITDTTSGRHRSNHSGAGMSPASAQITGQGGSGVGNFAPFTPIVFSSIMLNGAPFAAAAPTGFKQVDSVGKVMIKTSGLQASGTQFTLHYVRNT